MKHSVLVTWPVQNKTSVQTKSHAVISDMHVEIKHIIQVKAATAAKCRKGNPQKQRMNVGMQ